MLANVSSTTKPQSRDAFLWIRPKATKELYFLVQSQIHIILQKCMQGSLRWSPGAANLRRLFKKATKLTLFL